MFRNVTQSLGTGHIIWNDHGKEYEEIHKLIVLIWNKEKLPQEWKESIIVPIHKKDDRMDCNNQGPDFDDLKIL